MDFGAIWRENVNFRHLPKSKVAIDLVRLKLLECTSTEIANLQTYLRKKINIRKSLCSDKYPLPNSYSV